MSKKKTKEFWIRLKDIKSSLGFPFFYAELCKRNPDPTKDDEEDFMDSVHVIEYSAFTALQAKCADYEETINNFACLDFDDNELTSLSEAEIEIITQAREVLAKHRGVP